MKKFTSTLAVLCLAANAFAFTSVTSAKSAALGGAGLAGDSRDVFAATINPASQTDYWWQVGGTFTKTEGVEPIYSLGAGFNFDYGITANVFGNYQYDSDLYDRGAGEAVAGASFSFKRAGFSLPVSVGFNLKYGVADYESPAKDETAFVGDVGFIINPINNLTIGAVYSNIGGKKNIYTEDTYGVGAAYKLALTQDHIFDLRFDMGKTDDHGYVATGGEYEWRNLIALRLGYMDNYDTDNFTYGVGVNLNRFGRIDGAYLPMDNDNKTYKLTYMIPFGTAPGAKTASARPVISKKSSSATYTDNAQGQTTPSYTTTGQTYPIYDTTGQTYPIYGTQTSSPREVIMEPSFGASTGTTSAATTTAVSGVKGVTNSKYPNERPKRIMR
ncbi:hypothetical protein Dip510_001990 [Elusimicrobium posterum]|uniref:hypothetical protein n=1 Tax=Elusimicrobium posterum TaxID=3116653 RepID=UPI003C76BBDC